MAVLDELKRLSTAEDFFRYLDVEFDPQVLNVARLHIMKRMGQYLASESDTSSDEWLRARCKQHLENAYQNFVEKKPIDERVFKVHQDAVRAQAPKTKQRIALQPLKKE